MSTSTTLRLTALLLLSGSALAQIVAPNCQTVPWGWTFNSLGQNACTVAAYLLGTCNGGAFTIDSLLPGYSYTGPSGVDDANMCKCNTVAYSLISACDACQNSNWITWSDYSFNCTRTLPPSTFPNAVPSGTRVPQWALIDITLQNNWSVNQSMAVGDTPEIAPGALISGPSGTTTATATSGGTATRASPAPTTFSAGNAGGPSSTSPPVSTQTGSSSNVGAIAGGVVGGVAAISIAVAAIFFYLRRQRSRAPPSAFVVDGPSPPLMDEIQRPVSQGPPTSASVLIPESPMTSMRLYDPSDPTTFPGYREPSPTHGSYSPYSDITGTGNTVATIHTTQPQARGYHGLPTV